MAAEHAILRLFDMNNEQAEVLRGHLRSLCSNEGKRPSGHSHYTWYVVAQSDV